MDTAEPALRLFSGTRILSRFASLRALLVALLLVAQAALLAHQFGHHLSVDLADLDNDCTVCHFATGMTAAPEAAELQLPSFTTVATVVPSVDDVSTRPLAPSRFRARAPPQHLSI